MHKSWIIDATLIKSSRDVSSYYNSICNSKTPIRPFWKLKTWVCVYPSDHAMYLSVRCAPSECRCTRCGQWFCRIRLLVQVCAHSTTTPRKWERKWGIGERQGCKCESGRFSEVKRMIKEVTERFKDVMCYKEGYREGGRTQSTLVFGEETLRLDLQWRSRSPITDFFPTVCF